MSGNVCQNLNAVRHLVLGCLPVLFYNIQLSPLNDILNCKHIVLTAAKILDRVNVKSYLKGFDR